MMTNEQAKIAPPPPAPRVVDWPRSYFEFEQRKAAHHRAQRAAVLEALEGRGEANPLPRVQLADELRRVADEMARARVIGKGRVGGRAVGFYLKARGRK